MNVFLIKLKKMTNNEKFVQFIEKYPECYSIIQSDIFVKFLNSFKSSPKSISELKRLASHIESLDLGLILIALESAKLIKQTTTTQNEVYFLTPKAKTLLKLYSLAKNA